MERRIVTQICSADDGKAQAETCHSIVRMYWTFE